MASATDNWLMTFADFSAAPDEPTNSLHLRLRAAAAVMAFFDPRTIQPIGPAAEIPSNLEAEARERLKSEADIISFDELGRPSFTLREGFRRKALRELESREAMRDALKANPRPIASPFQQAFERLLSGQSQNLEQLTSEDLAAMMAVISWLDGILTDLPSRQDVTRTLAYRQLHERIEKLAAVDKFIGRKAELERLSAHFTSPDRGPLLVWGPGGIGKSTLAARAALPLLSRGELVLWLDFDRTTLDPCRPVSILREIALQLSILLGPDRFRSLTRFSERLEIESQESVQYNVRSYENIVRTFISNLFSVAYKYRIVVIVDTFEYVQIQGNPVENAVIEIFNEFCRELPNVSVLMCGRAPSQPLAVPQFIEKRFIEELVLEKLDPSEATELLARLSGGYGMAGTIAKIVRELGGNPLVLQLAAEVMRREGLDALASPEGMNKIQAAIRDQRIQSMLYGRILSHLSEKSRRLASSGLVLRVITPEVISEVLAEPCHIRLDEPGEAEEYFGGFGGKLPSLFPIRRAVACVTAQMSAASCSRICFRCCPRKQSTRST